jgi:hypothetical protein
VEKKEEFQSDAYFTSCHGRWKLTRIRALVDPTSIMEKCYKEERTDRPRLMRWWE